MEIKPNEEQEEGINLMKSFIENKDLHKENFFTLDGKAGTGKSFCLARLVESYPTRRFIVAAISHKAKEVIHSRIRSKNVKAMTIASLLSMTMDENTGEFHRDPYAVDPPISEADIVIIDEGSMLDADSIRYMFEKKLYRTVLIFAGDKGQLPPITKINFKKPNNYSPIFNSPYKAQLKTRVRQGEDSPILEHMDYYWDFTLDPMKKLGNVLRADSVGSQGSIIYRNDMREVIENNLHHYRRAVDEGNTNIIKAVSYKRDNVAKINEIVRERLFGFNAPQFVEGELMIMGDTFQDDFSKVENSVEFAVTDVYPGIKQLDEYTFNYFQLEGTQTMLNGESKHISVPVIAAEHAEKFNRYVQKLFAEAKEATGLERKEKLAKAWGTKRSTFADARYGYAMTAHKSQGSTYDNVIVNLTDMLKAEAYRHSQEVAAMIYTAGTRARTNVTMVNKIPSFDGRYV